MNYQINFLMDISGTSYHMFGYCLDIFYIYKKYATKECIIWSITFMVHDSDCKWKKLWSIALYIYYSWYIDSNVMVSYQYIFSVSMMVFQRSFSGMMVLLVLVQSPPLKWAKYLRVYLDDFLSWNIPLNHLIPKLNRHWFIVKS